MGKWQALDIHVYEKQGCENNEGKRKADGRSLVSECSQNEPSTSAPVMHRTPDKK